MGEKEQFVSNQTFASMGYTMWALDVFDVRNCIFDTMRTNSRHV